MTGLAVRPWARPVPRWTPPLDGDALTTVPAKMREWEAFDGEALLDDVAAVLDDVVPAEEQVDELAQRLRGHLMQLVNIGVATEAAREDSATARLVEQARAVRSEDMPGDHWKAVGHLRRMGWTLNELLERLIAARCLREAA
ncbi:DUF6415 family natural product biosynthesis protein [Streptomyces nodosus]|uniref:DUF6415 family natural product biosynthesis protein n=1 Tax=Streptomyces nodosus TaxID=40318 RepID=UPI0034557C3C